MLIIDDIQWNVPCKIERISEMRASDISGMLLNKQYFADVLGTFLGYNVSLYIPFGKEDEYTQIYEKLTEPVGSHTVIAPYNQSQIEIDGRIENVKDTLIKRRNSNYWMEISFNITSNAPSKEMSLDEVIARGLPPLPDESDVPIGEAYINTTGGWVSLDDVDNSYY